MRHLIERASELLNWPARKRLSASPAALNASPASPPITPTTTAPAIVHPGSNGTPFPLLSSLVAAYRGAGSCPVLIFGDSVMERVSKFDEDQRSLGEIIAEIGDVRCHIASRSALNPTLVLALLRAMRNLQRPRVVVIPVNMRCFSPQWDLNPAWALHQELGAIEAWISNPDAAIASIADIRKSPDLYTAFEQTPVSYELSSYTTVGEFRASVADLAEANEHERRRQIFVFHYTHVLVGAHRKLIDLKAALSICRSMGCEPLVYITPLNVDAGVRACGARFSEIVAENIATLRGQLSSLATLIDWSTEMPPNAFFKQDLATEHLEFAGRSKLAELVVSQIKQVVSSGP